MKIIPIPCLTDNYAYIINDQTTKTISIVDPSESKPIIEFLKENKLKLNFIFNTHHHYDHIGGNIELKKFYDAKVIGFDQDKNRIPGIDIALKDNEYFKFGNLKLKLIHIPGHTLGHVCFYFEKEKIIFTGDTLFSLGCGRIFEGTYKQMYKSLEKIKNLPEDTKIYCGHEYTLKNSQFCKKIDSKNINLDKKILEIKSKRLSNLPTVPSTLKDELDCNVFLRCDDEEIKSSLNIKSGNSVEVFKKLRDLKDNF